MEGLESFKDKSGYTSGVSLTGRFNHAGQAFLEKPDQLPPNSRGTATMAPHVIVEVSVFDLHEPLVTLVCVYYHLLLWTI